MSGKKHELKRETFSDWIQKVQGKLTERVIWNVLVLLRKEGEMQRSDIVRKLTKKKVSIKEKKPFYDGARYRDSVCITNSYDEGIVPQTNQTIIHNVLDKLEEMDIIKPYRRIVKPCRNSLYADKPKEMKNTFYKLSIIDWDIEYNRAKQKHLLDIYPVNQIIDSSGGGKPSLTIYGLDKEKFRPIEGRSIREFTDEYWAFDVNGIKIEDLFGVESKDVDFQMKFVMERSNCKTCQYEHGSKWCRNCWGKEVRKMTKKQLLKKYYSLIKDQQYQKRSFKTHIGIEDAYKKITNRLNEIKIESLHKLLNVVYDSELKTIHNRGLYQKLLENKDIMINWIIGERTEYPVFSDSYNKFMDFEKFIKSLTNTTKNTFNIFLKTIQNKCPSIENGIIVVCHTWQFFADDMKIKLVEHLQGPILSSFTYNK